MSLLIALDPSVNSSGVAAFFDGKLIFAETIKVNVRGGDRADAAYFMSHKICDRLERWYQGYPFVSTLQDPEFVYEWPQIYRAGKGKGDPNDLPALAAIGLGVAGLLRCGVVKSYTPKEWAGQLPKATRTKALAENSPRAVRIKSRLKTAELSLWPKGEHDAIDAIGLGLFHLGRLSPKRVFPGASK
jgi:hypothetical protein